MCGELVHVIYGSRPIKGIWWKFTALEGFCNFCNLINALDQWTKVIETHPTCLSFLSSFMFFNFLQTAILKKEVMREWEFVFPHISYYKTKGSHYNYNLLKNTISSTVKGLFEMIMRKSSSTFPVPLMRVIRCDCCTWVNGTSLADNAMETCGCGYNQSPAQMYT